MENRMFIITVLPVGQTEHQRGWRIVEVVLEGRDRIKQNEWIKQSRETGENKRNL